MARYYAYYLAKEGKQGILNSWSECELLVKGKASRYKGFATEDEARNWLKSGAKYDKKELAEKKQRLNKYQKEKIKKKLVKGIYFDAGTGRGKGVEVRVTDENGIDLLPSFLSKSRLTEYNTYRLSRGKTNNYGELLGMFFALQIAEKRSTKRIFGDSKLVIDFWSKGLINGLGLPEDTVKYSNLTTALRKEFEENNGKVEHISGEINPADLGFHK